MLVRDGHGLTDAVHMLNDVMMEAADPLQFCTLAAALVRRSSGDEPPGLAVELLLAEPRAAGAPPGATERAEQVGAFGTAVGLLPQVLVEATTFRLGPGDTLLLYTDGVTERRRGREQFGPDRLLALARRSAGRSAREIVAAGPRRRRAGSRRARPPTTSHCWRSAPGPSETTAPGRTAHCGGRLGTPKQAEPRIPRDHRAPGAQSVDGV